MPDPDPANGNHSSEIDPRPEIAANRGSGILMVAVVSALTGAAQLIGGGLGFALAAILGLRNPVATNLILAAAGAGSIAGVVLGVRLGARFGASSEAPAAGRLGLVGGLIGLIGAVGLAAMQLPAIIAILIPGLGAWLGDRLAQRFNG